MLIAGVYIYIYIYTCYQLWPKYDDSKIILRNSSRPSFVLPTHICALSTAGYGKIIIRKRVLISQQL